MEKIHLLPEAVNTSEPAPAGELQQSEKKKPVRKCPILEMLPVELIYYISKFLDTIGVKLLRLTCRTLDFHLTPEIHIHRKLSHVMQYPDGDWPSVDPGTMPLLLCVKDTPKELRYKLDIIRRRAMLRRNDENRLWEYLNTINFDELLDQYSLTIEERLRKQYADALLALGNSRKHHSKGSDLSDQVIEIESVLWKIKFYLDSQEKSYNLNTVRPTTLQCIQKLKIWSVEENITNDETLESTLFKDSNVVPFRGWHQFIRSEIRPNELHVYPDFSKPISLSWLPKLLLHRLSPSNPRRNLPMLLKTIRAPGIEMALQKLELPYQAPVHSLPHHGFFLSGIDLFKSLIDRTTFPTLREIYFYNFGVQYHSIYVGGPIRRINLTKPESYMWISQEKLLACDPTYLMFYDSFDGEPFLPKQFKRGDDHNTCKYIGPQDPVNIQAVCLNTVSFPDSPETFAFLSPIENTYPDLGRIQDRFFLNIN